MCHPTGPIRGPLDGSGMTCTIYQLAIESRRFRQQMGLSVFQQAPRADVHVQRHFRLLKGALH